jgi:hypothetical protein
MNHWQYEQYTQIDKLYRQQMISEMQAQRLVQQYRIYHHGLFEQIMFNLANWMIGKGRQLRQRYEIPTTNCDQPASHSPAS